MTMRKSIKLIAVAVLVALSALLLAGCVNYAFRGSVITPPESLPDFKLTDVQRAPVSLSDLRGKAVLLYFGYTNCADACPLTLSHFAEVKRELGNDAAQVAFVFVTTDPERDTAEVLKGYLARFDPTIIGLRGTPDELASIYQAYHVAVEKQEPPAGQSGYTVGHSDVIYVLDRAGRWRDFFDSNSTVTDIVSDVRYLLNE